MRRLHPPSRVCRVLQDRGGALSLDAYMRLPTEQYHELDPAMISSLGGSAFLLRVPRVSVRGGGRGPGSRVGHRLGGWL